MKAVLTGGHLSPLLVVLDALSKEAKVLVIGRKYALEGDRVLSLEYQVLKKRGIPFKNITTGRLQRKFTKHTIFSLFKFPYGFIQSLIILMQFKPEIVLSFGGYISLPITLASAILGIPVVLHEQTLEAGLANRISSFFAKKICISWETSRKFFPQSKVILTGNPVKKFSIFNFQFSISDEKIPLIYITGGSSGSHALNVLVEGCLKELLRDYRIIHQTGGSEEFNDFNRLKNLAAGFSEGLRKKYYPIKFIEPSDIGSILASCDLVVSRSGINTIAELLFFRKPSLLIPLPFSQSHEQTKNAFFLKRSGLAEIVDQDKISPKLLYEKIVLMLENMEKYRVKKSAQELIKDNAAKKIVEVVYAQKK